MDDLWELARQGKLPPIIRVDKVECAEHGSLLPEAFSLPFSVSTDVLVALPFACGICRGLCGDEHAFLYPPLIDWQECEKPLTQHLAQVGYDPDARPQYYGVWEVRPSERADSSSTFRTGSYQQVNNPE